MMKCGVGNLFKKKITIKLKQQTAQNSKSECVFSTHSASTAKEDMNVE